MSTETPDQARTRRRWISLAELVAVAGVIIAALTLWNSWSERRSSEAEQQQKAVSETKARTTIRLEGTVEQDGGRLKLADPDHKIDTIDVRFPAALGIAAQTQVLDPHIDASWFAPALLKATATDEGKLPVLITSGWWDADTHRTDTGLYLLSWNAHGRFLRGRELAMEGIALQRRNGTRAQLDAWKPAAKAK